jgi:DNA-binding response OmpR family regulator
MNNILIVEDESLVALEISNYIKELGYNVVGIAASADRAIELVENKSVDLILMDVYLKGEKDGIEAASKIRQEHHIPVIYISAFSDDETLERAIATNPISYLTKPFNRKELQVAIKIALNRKRRREDNEKKLYRGDIIFDDDFSFDTKKRALIYNGEIIHLTKQEQRLLELLIEYKNNIVTVYDMENYLWPDKESNENTRRALVSRLRAKLNYKFIETIHSMGYRLKI